MIRRPLVLLVLLAACSAPSNVITVRDGERVPDVKPGQQLDIVMEPGSQMIALCDFYGGTLVGVTCVDVDF